MSIQINKKRRRKDVGETHECPYCGKKFEIFKSYMRHLKLHETRPRYQCEICGKHFHEKSTLNRHLSVTHFGIKQYECTVCVGKYASKENLDKHMRTLHPTAPEIQMNSIKCSDCECYFKNKIHHSIHVRTYHRTKAVQEAVHSETKNTNKNTDGSSNSNKPNSDTDDLLAKALEKSEVELVPEPDIRTAGMVMKNHRPHFECDICGYLQIKFSSMKKHMLLHSTTKLFQCSSCDCRFKNLSGLRHHIKRVHNLKCKSNNNKVLWKTLHDLNNHIWTDTMKKKNEIIHIVKKGKKKTKKIFVDNDNLKGHVDEDLHENENIQKLSMPILDEQSISSLPEVNQSNKTKNSNPTTIVPVSEIGDIDKNVNHLEEINSLGRSNQSNVMFAEPIISTGILKDALLGQANVPLIKKIDVNSRDVAEKYPQALTKGTFNDQLSMEDVNTGFTCPLNDTDLCAESGLLDKNLLQIIGLNDIMVNEEPNESCQPNREIYSQELAPNKLQGNFSNIPIKGIIKLKEHETDQRAIIISSSSKTLSNKDSIMVTPEIGYENNVLLVENRISEICNNVKMSDFHQFNETQSDSRLSGKCGNNTDVSLNECNIDVSFDINELSGEFDNANISLTDIVEGMCSQNYFQQNACIDGENCAITNQSNDEVIVNGKAIIPVTTTNDRPETEIVNVESYLLGNTNEKESFNTYNDNINYGSDISLKTIAREHKNMNTCTVAFHIQETNQFKAIKPLEIENHDHQKNNEFSQVMSIVMLSSCANSVIDTKEKPEILNDKNMSTVPIHIKEANPVQATNTMEIEKYVYQNMSESPQIKSTAMVLPTSALSIVDTVQEPEIPNDMSMCTGLIHMQETNQIQATNPMEIEKSVYQNVNVSSQIKTKLVLPTSVNSIIDAVEDPEPSTNYNTNERQIEFTNACLTNFDIEDPLGIFSTSDIIQSDDNALLPYHEETNINNIEMCTGIKGNFNSQLSHMNHKKISENVLQNNLVANECSNEALFMVDQYPSKTMQNLVNNANYHHQNKPPNNYTPNPLELPSDSSGIQNFVDNIDTKVNLSQKDPLMQYDLNKTFEMDEYDRHFTLDPQLQFLESNVSNQDTRTHAFTDCKQLENIDTTSKPLIQRHMSTKQTNTKEGPLSTCKRYSSTFEKILKKMNGYKYKCEECPASFQYAWNLQRHGDTHKPRPKYLCDLCSKVCHSKTAIKTHMKYHNSKKTLCWVCGRMICEINFDRHKCFSTYVYTCPLCDETFLSGHIKKRHILKKHIHKSNGQRKNNSPNGAEDSLVGLIEQLNEDSCEIFNPIKNKVASVDKNNLQKPKIYKCEFCPKEYKQNFSLSKHIETHKEKRQEECECGAVFKKKLLLLQHQKKNGNKPHKNPFTCKLCGKAFSMRSMLKMHLEKYKCQGKIETSH